MSKNDMNGNDFTGDPYWGKGGSYIVDPTTGKRVPAPTVAEVQEGTAAVELAAPSDTAPAEPAAPVAPITQPLKEKQRG